MTSSIPTPGGHEDAAPLRLFEEPSTTGSTALPGEEQIGDGAFLFRGLALQAAPTLTEKIEKISTISPWRHLVTPGGFRMSVAMTNCGEVGWVSDRSGYRYQTTDPETGHRWPPMPASFRELARAAASSAGFNDYRPDVCLINRYEPGARMSLHQDRNERRTDDPIVSVSLGLSATFLFGGLDRNERPDRHRLHHGDVVVWGGASRMAFHGVAPLRRDTHAELGAVRLNITFRKAR